MNKIYFTPGPSQLYPTVPEHLQSALREGILSLSHRSAAFKGIYEQATMKMRDLLTIPEDYHIVFLPSATEAMERITQGVVKRKSLHVTTGAFGDKFYQIARQLGKDATLYNFTFSEHESMSISGLSEEPELLCFTHNETSNGSQIPMELIYTARNQYPEALIAIDVVSSIPHVELDFSRLDLVFFSVQKGFGLPAGLGVLIVSPRAYERSLLLESEGWDVGTYHSLPSLVGQGIKFQTPETPNVLGIYLFAKVLDDMHMKGIGAIRKETKAKAKMLYDYLDDHPSFAPVMAAPYRSETVIVTAHSDTERLHQKFRDEQFVVGKGYGKMKEQHIRIANFPAIPTTAVEKLITLLG